MADQTETHSFSLLTLGYGGRARERPTINTINRSRQLRIRALLVLNSDIDELNQQKKVVGAKMRTNFENNGRPRRGRYGCGLRGRRGGCRRRRGRRLGRLRRRGLAPAGVGFGGRGRRGRDALGYGGSVRRLLHQDASPPVRADRWPA